ncbi:3-ketoacyl-ACP reductase [Oryzibacter oryziterrae]|uniref:3-ketoacyl-ACP reductase n=1 Tax=Oryzibacter oryziterrae TaxID=2766474 RepID=UPI001F017FE0|nr:3-ketoacyl-ACP reductase [Oryzibacter oryziterrae]
MTRPVALVTGGRRGIGRAIALELARNGHDVAIADMADDGAAEVLEAIAQAGGRGMFARFDLGDLSTHAGLLDAVTEALGPVDVLVNNAGRGAVQRGDLLDLTPENFDVVMDVNLRGTVFLTQTVVRQMLTARPRHRRSVITVTSVSAAAASPERMDYCVSKAALSMFVANLALRLAGVGIGVFEVRPGIIATDMTAGVREKYDGLIAGGLVPQGRWGEGEDVARAVAALASGAFGFAQGQIVNVDGGLTIARL